MALTDECEVVEEVDLKEALEGWEIEEKVEAKEESKEVEGEGKEERPEKEERTAVQAIEERVERELERAGEEEVPKVVFKKLRLITYDKRPSEYEDAKVTYKVDAHGRIIQEIREFTKDPKIYRSLRAKFYRLLHTCAFNTTMGWVLYKDPPKELEEVLEQYRKLENRPVPIYIIDVWVPKHYVIQELNRYIAERKASYERVIEKLQEAINKRAKKRISSLRSEAKKIMREIEELEKVLREYYKK